VKKVTQGERNEGGSDGWQHSAQGSSDPSSMAMEGKVSHSGGGRSSRVGVAIG
jgi:hypothetical protein